MGLGAPLVEDYAQDPHINARAETVHEKALFREAFVKRRALIPATGFFEWQLGRCQPGPRSALFRLDASVGERNASKLRNIMRGAAATARPISPARRARAIVEQAIRQVTDAAEGST